MSLQRIRHRPLHRPVVDACTKFASPHWHRVGVGLGGAIVVSRGDEASMASDRRARCAPASSSVSAHRGDRARSRSFAAASAMLSSTQIRRLVMINRPRRHGSDRERNSAGSYRPRCLRLTLNAVMAAQILERWVVRREQRRGGGLRGGGAGRERVDGRGGGVGGGGWCSNLSCSEGLPRGFGEVQTPDGWGWCGVAGEVAAGGGGGRCAGSSVRDGVSLVRGGWGGEIFWVVGRIRLFRPRRGRPAVHYIGIALIGSPPVANGPSVERTPAERVCRFVDGADRIGGSNRRSWECSSRSGARYFEDVRAW